MTNTFLLLALGLAAGVFSGLVGVGGGLIVVPMLVFAFGLSQHAAQGTTLAMLVPPIGILAAWTYYRQGYADLKMAGILCLGFFLGGLLGAKFAVHLSGRALERVFGCVMLAVGARFLFFR